MSLDKLVNFIFRDTLRQSINSSFNLEPRKDFTQSLVHVQVPTFFQKGGIETSLNNNTNVIELHKRNLSQPISQIIEQIPNIEKGVLNAIDEIHLVRNNVNLVTIEKLGDPLAKVGETAKVGEPKKMGVIDLNQFRSEAIDKIQRKTNRFLIGFIFVALGYANYQLYKVDRVFFGDKKKIN